MKRFPRLPAPSSPVHHVTRVTVLTVVRLAVLFSVVMFAAGCSNGDGSPASSTAAGDVRMAERVGLTMGSSLKLGIPTTDPAAAEQAFDAVFAEFNRLDALLSVWKPGSDVLRVNGAAGIEPTTVGDDTMAVLEIAKQISEWTEGTFDVTFGAMADIWKFDHDQDNRVPSREEVDARRPLIDYRAIHLDPPGHTALLEKHGMKNHMYWIPTDAKLKDNTLIYVVSHASMDAAKKSWSDFINDPEWKAAAEASEKDGKILAKRPEAVYMTLTDYSPPDRSGK